MVMRRFLRPAVLGAVLFLFSLSPAQNANWPNEAAGSQVLTDWPFNSALGGAWTAPFGYNGSVISSSQTAGMVSPPAAIHNYRDATSRHGGDLLFGLPGTLSKYYFAFVVRLSNPHYGWFNGQYQKLALIEKHNYIRAVNIYGASDCQIRPYLNSLDNTHLNVPLHEMANAELVENVTNRRFALGQWHKVEVFYQASTSTTSRDGILTWWVDGEKIGSYNNLNLNRPESFKICNVWDSENPALPREEWVEYDHARVSVPPSNDIAKPTITNLFPVSNATGVSGKTLISFHIKDDHGVDSNSIVMKVNGLAVARKLSGTQWDYTVTYPAPAAGYPAGSKVQVAVDVKDRAGNVLPTYNYSFTIVGTPGIHPKTFLGNAFQTTPQIHDVLGRDLELDSKISRKNASGVYLVTGKTGTNRKARSR